MPFVIEKKGEQWCCYTQAEDGGPKGEPHGCHPTREEAVQQLRALYANVPDASKADKPTGSQGAGERYADPGYQDDKQPRYPVTDGGKVSADRVRAAWSYIHQGDNRRLYTAEQLGHIEGVIRAAAKEAGVELAAPAKADDGQWIAFGSACKALGDGRVGGYLVQFGGPGDADADGEYFTAETDFDTEFPARASVYYNHGCDPKWGRKRLARGAMKRDERGVPIEAQLDLSDPDQARLYRRVVAGEMGWSSGTASHITDPPRSFPGGAIKHWPLGIDASITPTPSDRRNVAVALKSWNPPSFDDLEARGDQVDTTSLAESTERLADRYREIAMKSGRRLSNARWQRLKGLSDEILALLSETDPAGAGNTELADAASRDGEPPNTDAQASPDADAEALYLAFQAQANGVNWPQGVSP